MTSTGIGQTGHSLPKTQNSPPEPTPPIVPDLNIDPVPLDLPVFANTPSSLHNSTRQSKSLVDFELLKVIGRGSYGKCYLVRRIKSGELLAMKVMHKKELVNRNVLDNIKAERLVLEKINHPYLVSLRYAFQTDEKLYLLMQYQSGGEMFAKIERDGSFIEAHARFYLQEIIVALNYLHQNGIIYRDLKPENVLFQSSGHIALTDFGFAKNFAEKAEIKTKSFCGSLQYLAPEIVKREEYNEAVDFWCCGIFFFELLTGRTPFSSTNRSDLLKHILGREIKYPKNFSKELISLFKGLLDRNPQTRFTFEQIKKHPYFATTDWKAVANMTTVPPFVPELKSDIDVSLFDPRFTSEEVIDTPPFGPTGLSKHDAFRHSSVNPISQQIPHSSNGTTTMTTAGDSENVIVNRDVDQFLHDREGLRHLSRRKMTPLSTGADGNLNPLPPLALDGGGVGSTANEKHPSTTKTILSGLQPPKLNSQDNCDDSDEQCDLFPELPGVDRDGVMTVVDTSSGQNVVFRNSIKKNSQSSNSNGPIRANSSRNIGVVENNKPASGRKESFLYTADDNNPRNVFQNFSFSAQTPDLAPLLSAHNSMTDFKLDSDKNNSNPNKKKEQTPKKSRHVPKDMPNAKQANAKPVTPGSMFAAAEAAAAAKRAAKLGLPPPPGAPKEEDKKATVATEPKIVPKPAEEKKPEPKNPNNQKTADLEVVQVSEPSAQFVEPQPIPAIVTTAALPPATSTTTTATTAPVEKFTKKEFQPRQPRQTGQNNENPWNTAALHGEPRNVENKNNNNYNNNNNNIQQLNQSGQSNVPYQQRPYHNRQQQHGNLHREAAAFVPGKYEPKNRSPNYYDQNNHNFNKFNQNNQQTNNSGQTSLQNPSAQQPPQSQPTEQYKSSSRAGNVQTTDVPISSEGSINNNQNNQINSIPHNNYHNQNNFYRPPRAPRCNNPNNNDGSNFVPQQQHRGSNYRQNYNPNYHHNNSHTNQNNNLFPALGRSHKPSSRAPQSAAHSNPPPAAPAPQ
jgi:serine/threonine protein kinase